MKFKTGKQILYSKIALNLLLISLLLMSGFLYGQTIERQVISSSGNIIKANTLQVSSTSGETAVNTVATGTIILTQGFQQPLIEDFTGTINLDNNRAEITIFPNPANSSVNLTMKSINTINPVIEIEDITGKKVLPGLDIPFSGEIKHTFYFSELPTGTYFLIIKEKKGKNIKAFKIIKI